MKIRSFRYLVGEGFKNIWANRLMSLASVGVLVACMLIMGVSIALTLNVDAYVGNLEERNVIMVFFDKELSDEECQAIYEDVKDVDNVLSDSAEYITKDEFFENEKHNAFGDNPTNEQSAVFDKVKENGNPLPNGARIQIDDLGKFDETLAEIESLDGIYNTRSNRDVVEEVHNLRSIVNNACMWIIALLLIISFVIVSNTIRITMYSRKLEISIMKAVGATNRFIRFPFMVEGVILGSISAVATTTVLYVVYYFANRVFVDKMQKALIPFSDMVWLILGVFAVIGIVLGLLCSLFTITKYLRKEGSEFRAI